MLAERNHFDWTRGLCKFLVYFALFLGVKNAAHRNFNQVGIYLREIDAHFSTREKH